MQNCKTGKLKNDLRTLDPDPTIFPHFDLNLVVVTIFTVVRSPPTNEYCLELQVPRCQHMCDVLLR